MFTIFTFPAVKLASHINYVRLYLTNMQQDPGQFLNTRINKTDRCLAACADQFILNCLLVKKWEKSSATVGLILISTIRPLTVAFCYRGL